VPAAEADQVVERRQRQRERKQLPVEGAELGADLAPVGVEAEPDRDCDRQRDREEDRSLQVR